MRVTDRLIPIVAVVVSASASLLVITTSQTLAINGKVPAIYLAHKIGLVSCSGQIHMSTKNRPAE